MFVVWENLDRQSDRQTDRQSSLMSFYFDAKNYIKLEIKHREIIF